MEEDCSLLSGETIDALGYQGLRIIQNPAKFKFTMDAFLLAGFIDPQPRHHLIDLGTGSGVLPLLIAGQSEIGFVYGLEIQPELAAMAERNVILNQLSEKVKIVTGDIRTLPDVFKPNSFDYVISNPPFFKINAGLASENQALALAKFEIACNLQDVVKAASRLVRANGKVAFIYPSERLGELILALDTHHLAPKRIRFVHPKPTVKSNLVVVEARPGVKNGPEVLPPLFIYHEAGEYTQEMNQIFHGKKL